MPGGKAFFLQHPSQKKEAQGQETWHPKSLLGEALLKCVISIPGFKEIVRKDKVGCEHFANAYRHQYFRMTVLAGLLIRIFFFWNKSYFLILPFQRQASTYTMNCGCQL